MAQANAETLDCGAAMRQLFDYLDGELTATRRALVHEHLVACKACYAHHDFYTTFLSALATSQPSTAAPAALRARLLAALEAEGFRKTG